MNAAGESFYRTMKMGGVEVTAERLARLNAAARGELAALLAGLQLALAIRRLDRLDTATLAAMHEVAVCLSLVLNTVICERGRSKPDEAPPAA